MDGKSRLQPGTASRGSGPRSPPMDALLEQMASTEENARALVDRLRRKLSELREAQDPLSTSSRDLRNNETHATGDRIAQLQSSGTAKAGRVSSAPGGKRSQTNVAAFFKVPSSQPKYALANAQTASRSSAKQYKTASTKPTGDKASRTTAESFQMSDNSSSRSSFLEGDKGTKTEKLNKEYYHRPSSWGPSSARSSKSRDTSLSREHSRSQSPFDFSFSSGGGSKGFSLNTTTSKSSRASIHTKDSRPEKRVSSGKSSQTTLSRKHSDNRKAKLSSPPDSSEDLCVTRLSSKGLLKKRKSSKSVLSSSKTRSREATGRPSSSRTASRKSSQNKIPSRHSSHTKISSRKASQAKLDSMSSKIKIDNTDTNIENRKQSHSRIEGYKASYTKIDCHKASHSKLESRKQSQNKIESRKQSQCKIDDRKQSQSKVGSRKSSQTKVPSRKSSQNKVESRRPSQSLVNNSRILSPTRTASSKLSPLKVGSHKSSSSRSSSRRSSQTKVASHKSSPTKIVSHRLSPTKISSRKLSPPKVSSRKSSPTKVTSRKSSATKCRSRKSSTSNVVSSAPSSRKTSQSTMLGSDYTWSGSPKTNSPSRRSSQRSVQEQKVATAGAIGSVQTSSRQSSTNTQTKSQGTNKSPSRKSSGTTAPLVKLSKEQLKRIFSNVRVEKWKNTEEKSKIFCALDAGATKKPAKEEPRSPQQKQEGNEQSSLQDSGFGSNFRRPAGVRSMGVAVERLLREAERGAELTSNALRSLKAAERQLHEAATSPWLPVLALGRARSPEAMARAAGHEERVAQATRWVAHALDDVMRCFDAYGELERQLAKPEKPGGYHWHEWSEAEVASALKAIAAAEGALAVDAAAALAAHAVTLDLLASDAAALEVFEQRQRQQQKLRQAAAAAAAESAKSSQEKERLAVEEAPKTCAFVMADGDARPQSDILTMMVNVPVSRTRRAEESHAEAAAESKEQIRAADIMASEGEGEEEERDAPESYETEAGENSSFISSSNKTINLDKETSNKDTDFSNRDTTESSDAASYISEEGQSLSSKASNNTAGDREQLGNASSLKTIREVASVETTLASSDLTKRGSSYTTCPSPSVKMSVFQVRAAVPLISSGGALVADEAEVATWTLQNFDESDIKIKEEPEKEEEIRTSHSLHEAAHILSNVASKKAVVVSNSWVTTGPANEEDNDADQAKGDISVPLSEKTLFDQSLESKSFTRSDITGYVSLLTTEAPSTGKDDLETMAAGILEDIMSKVVDMASHSQFADAEEMDPDVESRMMEREKVLSGMFTSKEEVKVVLSEAVVQEECSEVDDSDTMEMAESATKLADSSAGDRKAKKAKRRRSRSRSESPKKSKKRDEEAKDGGRKGGAGLEERLTEWKTERAAEVWAESLDGEQPPSTTADADVPRASSRGGARSTSSSAGSKSVASRYASAISGVSAPDEPKALVCFTEHLQRDGFQVEYTSVADPSGKPSSVTKLRVRASACGMSAEATASASVVAQRRATLLLAAELARLQASGLLPVGVSCFKDDELLALATLARVEAGSAGAETWLLAECQRRRRSPPRFRVVAAPGPTSIAAPGQQLPASGSGGGGSAHDKQPHFIVECSALDLCAAGMGPKKYSARRAAAEELLEMLDKIESEQPKEDSARYTTPSVF